MEHVLMKGSNPRLDSTNSPPKARSRARAESFGDFVPDNRMSEPERAAQFLDWCATHMPHRFVPYVWIAKHAYVKNRLPTLNSDDVESLRRNKMDKTRQILWKTYGRRTVPSPKIDGQEPGTRATVDSDDLAATDYLRRTRRIASGVKSAAETRAKIDLTEMRNKDLKAMVKRMDPVMEQLGKANIMAKLELPKHEDEDD